MSEWSGKLRAKSMPYLNHPPIRQLIRSIPVADHSVEVNADLWLPFSAAAGRLAEHHALFAGQATVRISRQWLHGAATVTVTTRCLAILLWGYPTGARGDLHRRWLKNLPQIAATASAGGLAWSDYYAQLHAIGGLGISTISKLACFFGQTFSGQAALVLDQRILRVIAGGRWAELGGLQGLFYTNAHLRYVEYLTTMGAIAEARNVTAEQMEFFLFALGEAF
jgi:hypothetical protein